MPYDIETIRKNIRKAVSGKYTDPDEFRPDKAKDKDNPIKYRFFILPPFKEGDLLKGGPATASMDNFFVPNGQHWINDKPHGCPRVWDNSDCPVCSIGFDLLKECKEKKADDERKQQVLRTWMPATYYMVNIYFTNWKGNPEDLRGKVKYYNAPKTCLDKWMATLMKDDKGDEEDPDAYGVFFDETAAFCFELVAAKEGKNNGYKTSAFIKNNGIPVPMIMNEDRTPNSKKLEALLQQRINLFTKIEKPDSAKLEREAKRMLGDDDDDNGGGFDSDETIEVPPSNTSQKAVLFGLSSVVQTEAKATQKPVRARSEMTETAKKPQPTVDDDEDMMDHLVDNSLDNETPLAESKSDDKSSDDIDGDDINSLLSQLED